MKRKYIGRRSKKILDGELTALGRMEDNYIVVVYAVDRFAT